MRRNGRGASGLSGPAPSADRDDCRSRPTRLRSRRSSTHRSTTASSDRVRTVFWARASNTDPATTGGRSTRTREISRTRTTLRRRSAHRRWRSADVPERRVSSRLISLYGDRIVAHHDFWCAERRAFDLRNGYAGHLGQHQSTDRVERFVAGPTVAGKNDNERRGCEPEVERDTHADAAGSRVT